MSSKFKKAALKSEALKLFKNRLAREELAMIESIKRPKERKKAALLEVGPISGLLNKLSAGLLMEQGSSLKIPNLSRKFGSTLRDLKFHRGKYTSSLKDHQYHEKITLDLSFQAKFNLTVDSSTKTKPFYGNTHFIYGRPFQLSDIASNFGKLFTEYQIEQFSLEYEPFCGSLTEGLITLGSTFDNKYPEETTDPTSEQVSQLSGAVQRSLNKGFKYHIQDLGTSLFSTDLHDTEHDVQFVLVGACQGIDPNRANLSYGIFHVDMKIAFYGLRSVVPDPSMAVMSNSLSDTSIVVVFLPAADVLSSNLTVHMVVVGPPFFVTVPFSAALEGGSQVRALYDNPSIIKNIAASSALSSNLRIEVVLSLSELCRNYGSESSDEKLPEVYRLESGFKGNVREMTIVPPEVIRDRINLVGSGRKKVLEDWVVTRPPSPSLMRTKATPLPRTGRA
jgi:hypothetical protein